MYNVHLHSLSRKLNKEVVESFSIFCFSEVGNLTEKVEKYEEAVSWNLWCDYNKPSLPLTVTEGLCERRKKYTRSCSLCKLCKHLGMISLWRKYCILLYWNELKQYIRCTIHTKLHPGLEWRISIASLVRKWKRKITNLADIPYLTSCNVKLILSCFKSILTIETVFLSHHRVFLCYYVRNPKFFFLFVMYFRYS